MKDEELKQWGMVDRECCNHKDWLLIVKQG